MHLAANTIFIWIPNCGGTSIAKHWFRKRLVIWNWKEGMKTETWVRDLETINQHATYDRYAVLYPNHNYITQEIHMVDGRQHTDIYIKWV